MTQFKYNKMLKLIEGFGNLKTTIRKIQYELRGGKGRPRKDDYITLKVKDVPDYKAFEMLENSFTTSYTI